MSQQILTLFLSQVTAANKGFTEKRSSLKNLLAALRGQIANGNCVPFTNLDQAKALCSDPADKRLTKYGTALANLVNTWGKQAIITPPQTQVTPLPVVPPHVPVPPPRLVSNSMNGDPQSLLDRKRDDLNELGTFASADASNFGGKPFALEKEKALLKDIDRCAAYNSAAQAAAGKQKLPQSTLKAVYDWTIEGQAAVCTTFACAAAYILTDGSRQSGKVRVEVLGCARGRGTHMYCVAGRHESSTIEDPSSWGDHAYIVDPWGTATYGNKLIMKVSGVVSHGGNFAAMYFAKVKQFYDNATPDPTAEDNKTQVNVQSVEVRLAQRKAEQIDARKVDEGGSELARKLAARRVVT